MKTYLLSQNSYLLASANTELVLRPVYASAGIAPVVKIVL